MSDATIIVSEEHIDPLRDEGYIIYKLGYFSAVSSGKREAHLLWGNAKSKAYIPLELTTVSPILSTDNVIIKRSGTAYQTTVSAVEDYFNTKYSLLGHTHAYLSDAPADGSYYARRNNTWAAVTDTNNYPTALGFSSGVLSLSRYGLADITVSIDDRYSLIGHTHDYAAASGSGSYIQNQNSGAQTANYWINGLAKSGTAQFTTGAAANTLFTGDATGLGSWSTVNQAIGGNALTSGYLPYWDGSKLANSSVLIGNNYGVFTDIKGGDTGPGSTILNFKNNLNDIKVVVRGDGNLGVGYYGDGFSAGSEINHKLSVNGNAYINTSLRVNGLSGTGTRLTTASSDGTLGSITNASGFLYNDGGGNYSYSTPSVSYTETDPIFTAHTVSNIINGTGLLRNNGTGTWSYDNFSVQSLSGTAPTWNASSGMNATITLTGNTTITLSNLVAGTSGNLTVINAASIYTLTVAGYTNKISPSVYSTTNRLVTSGNSKIDVFSWYYDGTYLIWNGGNNYR